MSGVALKERQPWWVRCNFSWRCTWSWPSQGPPCDPSCCWTETLASLAQLLLLKGEVSLTWALPRIVGFLTIEGKALRWQCGDLCSVRGHASFCLLLWAAHSDHHLQQHICPRLSHVSLPSTLPVHASSAGTHTTIPPRPEHVLMDVWKAQVMEIIPALTKALCLARRRASVWLPSLKHQWLLRPCLRYFLTPL